MSLFSYLAIIFSIVIGLTLSRLVSALVSSIRAAFTGNFYFLPMLWVANLLIWISILWWGMFAWSNKEDWTLIQFNFLVFYVIIIFMMSDFLVADNKKYDTTEQFLDKRKGFFASAIAAWIFDIFETVQLSKEVIERPIPDLYPVMTGLTIALLIVGIKTRNLLSQKIIVIIVFLELATYIVAS